MNDELTEEMHGELSINDADDIKYRCWTALLAIDSGIFTREEAAKKYGVTGDQIQEHEAEYRKLQD